MRKKKPIAAIAKSEMTGLRQHRPSQEVVVQPKDFTPDILTRRVLYHRLLARDTKPHSLPFRRSCSPDLSFVPLSSTILLNNQTPRWPHGSDSSEGCA